MLPASDIFGHLATKKTGGNGDKVDMIGFGATCAASSSTSAMSRLVLKTVMTFLAELETKQRNGDGTRTMDIWIWNVRWSIRGLKPFAHEANSRVKVLAESLLAKP